MIGVVTIILCIIAGYFFGGLSGGYIIGKLYHVDVRKHGSGNLGTTNVLRTLGKKAALITLCIDLGKVIFPILIIRHVIFPQYPAFTYENQLLILYFAIGTVIGHIFPFMLKFHGGKGVACMGATMLLFDCRLALLGLTSFILIVAITRYVSVASIFESLLFLSWIVFVLDYSDLHMIVATCAFPILIITMHRANIVRLLNGTENKISFKKKEEVKKS